MLNQILCHLAPHFGSLPAQKIYRNCEPGLVSVVLPVYNGEKYLKEAVESVLAQTYPRWELIIVNDGSVDASPSIAEQYAAKEKRISVIHQENQKLPRALNRGFSKARGEYFTWISADNRMLPNCLAVLTEELRRRPKVDMVYANMRLIDQEGRLLTGHGWFPFPPGSANVYLPVSTALLNTVPNNTIGAAFLYRGSVDTVLGGYSPRQFLLEDYDYFMRLNSLFCIRHTREKTPLYEYRFHDDSLTAHDAELGITSSRPKLMEFDRFRRNFYRLPLWVKTRALRPALSAALRRAEIFPVGKDAVNGRIFCLAGKAEKPYNTDMPVYVLEGQNPYFLKLPGGVQVHLATAGDLARFLRRRAACDLLWQEELKQF